MKGLAPLFLGIFGTFAFSWIGLTVIPTWQIGDLNPESDEEGTDIYPRPQSGMFERGGHVYAANGCVYCHSQQVRADYIADDIERKWGNRRSAPRDYIFERPVFLGKMRMGQDLANIGARAPAPEESPAPIVFSFSLIRANCFRRGCSQLTHANTPPHRLHGGAVGFIRHADRSRGASAAHARGVNRHGTHPAQVRMKPSHSPSAQASAVSNFSPCAKRSAILVSVAWK